MPAKEFLDVKRWEALHLEEFQKWNQSDWENSDSKTRRFLEHNIKSPPRMGKLVLFDHQRQALLRAIFSFEILKLNPILLNLATGTGKTVIMASFLAWLRCVYPDKIRKFIILCPNTIVRDRLKKDFYPADQSMHIFNKFDFFPREYSHYREELRFSIVERYESGTNIRGFQVIVTNRHQLQRGYSGGQDHLKLIIDEPGQIVVFNDEAHNTKGDEYENTLNLLENKTFARLDVTATPERADLQRPNSHEIYELSVVDAIESRPRIVKDVVVRRPSIVSYGAIDRGDLIFLDKATDQKFNIMEIEWDKLTSTRSTQLIMDPAPLKMQLKLAVEVWKKKVELAKGRYQPLLFCIGPSIAGAKQIEMMLKNEFKMNPLLVVDDESEYDKAELRKQAADIGTQDSTYDSVVSVYMLREGWDVPQVAVMCLLRGFGSELFAEQILGRGLRLIRENGLQNDPDTQELWVIDHPALKLDWLWERLGISVNEDKLPGEVRGREDITEKEVTPDLPMPEIVNKKLYDILFPLPSVKEEAPVSTSRALEILVQTLVQLKEFRPQDLIYVEVTTRGTKTLRRRSHCSTEEMEIYRAIQPGEIGRTALQRYVQGCIAELSKKLEQMSAFHNQRELLYNTILECMEKFALLGQPITEVDSGKLLHAYHALSSLSDVILGQVDIGLREEQMLQVEERNQNIGHPGLKLPDLSNFRTTRTEDYILRNPKKSPFNYEVMDSKSHGEMGFAEFLENCDDVVAWTKYHRQKIAYRDDNGKKRKYNPDFLVCLRSKNQRGFIEIKGKPYDKLPESKHKKRAGKHWCEIRGMFFEWKVV